MTHQRILFVCLGNICRSPTAEGVFRTKAQAAGLDLTIDSAGTSGWHDGDGPYGPAIAAAAKRGYDLSSLISRRFTPQDFAEFDLILGMDADNIAAIEAMRPKGSDTPVRLLMDYAPQSGTDTVPDPYYTRDFDGALDLIEAAADGLLERVAP